MSNITTKHIKSNGHHLVLVYEQYYENNRVTKKRLVSQYHKYNCPGCPFPMDTSPVGINNININNTNIFNQRQQNYQTANHVPWYLSR